MSVANYVRKLVNDIFKYANDNPRDFLFLVLLILTPFFLLSAYLSWKLAKQIKEKDSKQKKKASKSGKQARETKSHAKGSRVKRE